VASFVASAARIADIAMAEMPITHRARLAAFLPHCTHTSIATGKASAVRVIADMFSSLPGIGSYLEAKPALTIAIIQKTSDGNPIGDIIDSPVLGSILGTMDSVVVTKYIVVNTAATM
jgi:hypothetical protein